MVSHKSYVSGKDVSDSKKKAKTPTGRQGIRVIRKQSIVIENNITEYWNSRAWDIRKKAIAKYFYLFVEMSFLEKDSDTE